MHSRNFSIFVNFIKYFIMSEINKNLNYIMDILKKFYQILSYFCGIFIETLMIFLLIFLAFSFVLFLVKLETIFNEIILIIDAFLSKNF